ncbi:hypothetical protein DFP72DRAFT_852934 [Ephemerocybe angulata]|uniref:Uncharacterized protein n=1 Tax=Ephemerocybe angulata TaxID=980116 RepID=A0A8H6HL86_9AGAR|nr:hypothetical protein DFP72DRAFT_852934 [Tulosesus angulatus]
MFCKYLLPRFPAVVKDRTVTDRHLPHRTIHSSSAWLKTVSLPPSRRSLLALDARVAPSHWTQADALSFEDEVVVYPSYAATPAIEIGELANLLIPPIRSRRLHHPALESRPWIDEGAWEGVAERTVTREECRAAGCPGVVPTGHFTHTHTYDNIDDSRKSSRNLPTMKPRGGTFGHREMRLSGVGAQVAEAMDSGGVFGRPKDEGRGWGRKYLTGPCLTSTPKSRSKRLTQSLATDRQTNWRLDHPCRSSSRISTVHPPPPSPADRSCIEWKAGAHWPCMRAPPLQLRVPHRPVGERNRRYANHEATGWDESDDGMRVMQVLDEEEGTRTLSSEGEMGASRCRGEVRP